MGVRTDGDAKSARESEVRQLQVVVLAVDQQVLRFQVPVQNAVRVAVGDALQHLVQVQLHAGPTRVRGKSTGGV